MPVAAVAPLATSLTTTLAQVPVGTVVPKQGGVAPDAGLTNRSDLVFTYRNINEKITLWGADVALDYSVTNKVTLAGTYSGVSGRRSSQTFRPASRHSG